MDPLSITVIVPVYNERPLLAGAVASIRAAVEACCDDHEIVIVESGSTDGTAELADELAMDHPSVRVIHEGRRNGFGAAMRLGYAAATKDLVWLVTPDLPFPLVAIGQALPLLADHDCVLSYREADPRGPLRRLQSAVYNRIARALFRLRPRHVNSAFKLFRRPLIQGLELTSDGWTIDVEILARLRRLGVRCAEIPVALLDRAGGRSTIRPLTPLRVCRDLLALWWRMRSERPSGRRRPVGPS